ncbi:expressed unknown protein [Seminavis robusta]|uniref:Methyltransferase domain-containing protein n=1 Tax=Seminavis robusta TaxID=568900 RepID=A0A9N8DEQ7_9STRA|nr:expressed unknown protein [Seminavis robusta]|eukprot:Sro108_g054270.1 n/a (397) ;mRNA; r:82469-83730
MRRLRPQESRRHHGNQTVTVVTLGILLMIVVGIRNRDNIDDGLALLSLQAASASTSRSLRVDSIPHLQEQQQSEQATQQQVSAPMQPAATPAASVSSVASVSLASKPTQPISFDPSTKSLHPKWKLWNEMNQEQQKQAIQDIAPYLKKYGRMIHLKAFKLHIPQDKVCELFVPGSDHRLCGPAPPKPCTFMSFGINNDPSYDIKLADTWGCRGFAADPTIVHPSKLHPLVTFHNFGLTTLRPNEEKLVRPEEEWWYTSMPALRKFLKLDYVDIMKIDCEGCEVALARDILAEDPTFFEHIGQLTIETHVTKAWIETYEELYYFGLQFPLLEEAGFVMVTSMVFGCNVKHERYGCMPELRDWGFACGLGPAKKVARSCHDFLWVKKEKAYKYTNASG